MPQKTALVTGCSDGGIGAALATEFQARGLRVFATARDLSKMSGLAALGIETLALDVTSEASISQAVATVREKLRTTTATTGKEEQGRLDFLINNAGVQHVKPLSDTSMSELRHVIDTNVVGPLAVTQAFVPLLMTSDPDLAATDAGKSTVAMLGSVNDVYSPPFQVAYNASKAAVHSAARTLRVELAPLGIRCVTLMTGAVRTKLFENCASKVPEGSLYAAVADGIDGREFLKGAQWVDADEFAKQVVDDLLKTRPKLDIWRGGMARLSSWLACLGWEGMLDSAIFKANHLDKVGR